MDDANINYQTVIKIRYDRLNVSQWIKLTKFVFLKDIKCMMKLRNTRMYEYNYVHLINSELSKLVDIDNDMDDDDDHAS